MDGCFQSFAEESEGSEEEEINVTHAHAALPSFVLDVLRVLLAHNNPTQTIACMRAWSEQSRIASRFVPSESDSDGNAWKRQQAGVGMEEIFEAGGSLEQRRGVAVLYCSSE